MGSNPDSHSAYTSTSTSTSANIRNYVRNTQLSDTDHSHSLHTSHTSQHSGASNIQLQTMAQQAYSKPISYSSFEFEPKNELENNMIGAHEIQGHSSPARGANPDAHDFNFSFLDKIPSVPGEDEKDLENANSYRKMLKYIPNVDFLYDKSYPTLNKSGNTNSIPNTFHYKSHPNAKTKSALAIVTTNASSKANSQDSLPQSLDEMLKMTNSSPIRKPQEPPRMLDVIQDQTEEHNTTPDWMPPELNQKWLLQTDIEAPQHLDMPSTTNFSSSVRVTKSKNNEFDWNLPSTSDTMVHNSINKATTPMWQRAHKEYELNKKSQPHLQSIFMTQNTNTKSIGSSERNTDSSKLLRGKQVFGNSNSISSTFSTPLGTINHKPADLPQQVQPPSTVLNSNLPDSPLKLFGTRYNTFTKEKLNGLLAKMNTKTDLTPRTEGVINEVINDAPAILLSMTESNSNHLNGIKKFTERGLYTDKQFIDNADKLFKNLKSRGYSQNFRHLSNYQSATSTSTPRNDKLVKDIIDYANQELDPEEIEYSSYTSGFETDSGDSETKSENKENQDQEDATDEEIVKAHEQTSHNFTFTTTNNDYTTFAKLVSSDTNGDLPHIDKAVEELENEYTFDSFSEDAFTRELANVENSNTYAQGKQIINLKGLPVRPSITQPKSQSSPRSHIKPTLDMKAMMAQDNIGLDSQQTTSSQDFSKVKAQIAGLENGLEKILENMKLIAESKVDPKIITKKDDLNKLPDNSVLDMTQNSIQSVGSDVFDPDQTIKWKTGSQLQFQRLYGDQKPRRNLSEGPQNIDKGGPLAPIHGKNTDNQPILRGVLKRTADLPVAYDNMVLDVENHKWIPNDGREIANGSLDSIEDLVSDSQERSNSIIRKDSSFYKNNKRSDSKLEVSFNLPGEDTSIPESDITKNHPDVTLISRVGEVSFSQTVKKLVHAIAESLANEPEDWSNISKLSLVGTGLDSVKDLERFLPNLDSLDISNNSVRILDGIPANLLALKADNASLSDLTMFSVLHDLQRLSVSGNELTSLSALSSNIHLSFLNASKNNITSVIAISSLVNLVEIDLSLNNLMGEIDLCKFNLPNLQALNLSENRIQSVKGIEALPNLRILNLNENQIQNIKCGEPHLKMKKLLLKFNRLKELDLACYPFLRVLRIDGNMLSSVSGLHKLRNLDELSCKSQYDLGTLEDILANCKDVKVLDISGNVKYDLESFCVSQSSSADEFLNVNVLSLCAMDLSRIPLGFGKIFPNVRELNLNFNSITDISGLNELHHLNKLYLVSNSMVNVEGLVKGLISSRGTLKVLDVRLNPVNMELYPYVFNPHEMDMIQLADNRKSSPIQLETLDDIENFVIHYQALNKSELEWAERDTQFISQIAKEPARVNQRLNYEMVLVGFFNRLRKLDGSKVTREIRHQLKHRFNRT